MVESVVIDGVRYIPDPNYVDGVQFYFMHDNHTFTRLHGKTLDEVLENADTVEAGKRGSYGMLCPAMLMHGKKDVRRVGPPAHAKGSNDPKDNWNAGKAAWLAAVKADADVVRLMEKVP